MPSPSSSSKRTAILGAIEALGTFAESRGHQADVIIEATRDDRPLVRAAAIKALGKLELPDARVRPIFVSGLADSDRSVRLAVVNLLADEPELLLDMNGAVVDATTGRAYVTTDTGVSVVALDSLTVVDSVALSNAPAAIALSDDGTTLWVGFNFIAEIVSIDVATLTPSAPVSLTVDRSAIDLAIAPGTTDTVIIGDLDGRETYVVQAGSELPDTISGVSGGSSKPGL